jgi:uncharacterized integral membrane protein
MWIVRWLVLLLIVLVVLTFSLQNQSATAEIHFLGWDSGEMPLYVALFVAFALGMAAFLLIAVFQQLQALGELNRERKARKKLESQLEQTRQEFDQLSAQLEHAEVEKSPLDSELESLNADQEAAEAAGDEKPEQKKTSAKRSKKTKKTDKSD